MRVRPVFSAGGFPGERRLRMNQNRRLLRTASAAIAAAFVSAFISGCAAAPDAPAVQENSSDHAPAGSSTRTPPPSPQESSPKFFSGKGGTPAEPAAEVRSGKPGTPFPSTTPSAANPLNPPLAQKGIAVVRKRSGGEISVQAEIASNPRDRARGLMYRKTLGQAEGMLFVFPEEDELTFWMENTYLPLDMLFIRADGTIIGIVENAEPLTRTSRGVSGNSKFVLEVNGGFCSKNGIAAGDRVEIRGSYKTE